MTWELQNDTKNVISGPSLFKTSAMTAVLVATLGIGGASAQISTVIPYYGVEANANRDEATTTTFLTVQNVKESELSTTDTKEIVGTVNQSRESAVSESLERNIKKLLAIRNLKNNWNGEGAKAFTIQLLDSVKNIVKDLEIQPEIFPTALNTIQFEYDGQNDSYLEIEISDSNVARLYTIDRNGEEHYGSVNTSAGAINKLVNEFYAG